MMINRNINEQELSPELRASLRADAMRVSARPEEFWTGQRTRIRARLRDQASPQHHGFRFALAAALVFCFALLVVAPAGPPREVRTQSQSDADQQLLLSVERALAAGTPGALEPVTLMVDSSSNRNNSEAISHKEQRNEN